ncbi:MAG: tetratricopeptide repeat protein [Devosia sp.]
MTPLHFGRLTGTALLVLTLCLSGPAFAIPNGGGGGSSSDNTDTTPAPSSGPSLADGQADLDAHNWSKAITDLKAYLKTHAKSADGWNLLGFAYRNHGDLKLSDSAYERALKLNPNHTGALSYQGVLYVQLGELDEAKANLAKIKAICGNTTCAGYVALAKALN